MFCTQCGAPAEPTAKFCTICGTSLEIAAQPSAQDQQEALHWSNPFLFMTKSTHHIIVSLLFVAWLLWVLWIGVASDGFSKVKPLGWLIIFGAPIAVYLALLAALTIQRKTSMSKEVRFLFSANLILIFLVGAWGYIWNWESVFEFEEYLALFVLPLIGSWLSYFLWRWSKTG